MNSLYGDTQPPDNIFMEDGWSYLLKPGNWNWQRYCVGGSCPAWVQGFDNCRVAEFPQSHLTDNQQVTHLIWDSGRLPISNYPTNSSMVRRQSYFASLKYSERTASADTTPSYFIAANRQALTKSIVSKFISHATILALSDRSWATTILLRDQVTDGNYGD